MIRLLLALALAFPVTAVSPASGQNCWTDVSGRTVCNLASGVVSAAATLPVVAAPVSVPTYSRVPYAQPAYSQTAYLQPTYSRVPYARPAYSGPTYSGRTYSGRSYAAGSIYRSGDTYRPVYRFGRPFANAAARRSARLANATQAKSSHAVSRYATPAYSASYGSNGPVAGYAMPTYSASYGSNGPVARYAAPQYSTPTLVQYLPQASLEQPNPVSTKPVKCKCPNCGEKFDCRPSDQVQGSDTGNDAGNGDGGTDTEAMRSPKFNGLSQVAMSVPNFSEGPDSLRDTAVAMSVPEFADSPPQSVAMRVPEGSTLLAAN